LVIRNITQSAEWKSKVQSLLEILRHFDLFHRHGTSKSITEGLSLGTVSTLELPVNFKQFCWEGGAISMLGPPWMDFHLPKPTHFVPTG